MQDYVDAYSMLPWHLLGANKPKLVSKVNAGLSFIRKATCDLDFIEWFLGRDEFRHKVGWLEQTCWAALGHRIGCRLWNPEQVVLVRPSTSLSNQFIAGHFVKDSRYRMGEFLAAIDDSRYLDPAIAINTFSPPDCNLFELGRVHAMRQLKRLRNYQKIPSKVMQAFVKP
jgi:hypothetical protein